LGDQVAPVAFDEGGNHTNGLGLRRHELGYSIPT
jgi:hypothetical protein